MEFDAWLGELINEGALGALVVKSLNPTQLTQFWRVITDQSNKILALDLGELTLDEWEPFYYFIRHTKTLEKLRLRLSNVDIPKFCKLLEFNRTLRILDMGCLDFDNVNTKALGDAMRRNNTLVQLDLVGCKMQCLGALNKSLNVNRSLLCVSLNDARINDIDDLVRFVKPRFKVVSIKNMVIYSRKTKYDIMNKDQAIKLMQAHGGSDAKFDMDEHQKKLFKQVLDDHMLKFSKKDPRVCDVYKELRENWARPEDVTDEMLEKLQKVIERLEGEKTVQSSKEVIEMLEAFKPTQQTRENLQKSIDKIVIEQKVDSFSL